MVGNGMTKFDKPGMYGAVLIPMSALSNDFLCRRDYPEMAREAGTRNPLHKTFNTFDPMNIIGLCRTCGSERCWAGV